jgi:hypothetical protein
MKVMLIKSKTPLDLIAEVDDPEMAITQAWSYCFLLGTNGTLQINGKTIDIDIMEKIQKIIENYTNKMKIIETIEDQLQPHKPKSRTINDTVKIDGIDGSFSVQYHQTDGLTDEILRVEYDGDLVELLCNHVDKSCEAWNTLQEIIIEKIRF